MSVAEAIAGMLFIILIILLFPGVGLLHKMAKPIAIIINHRTKELRVTGITRKGKIYYTDEGAALERGFPLWFQTRFFGLISRKVILLLHGYPAPLGISKENLQTPPVTSEMFKAAIKSDIAIRFLRGGMDWKIIVILMLGIVAIGAIAYAASFPWWRIP